MPEAVNGRGDMERQPLGKAPYKGLVPYEERDWPYFFGHDPRP